MEDLIDQFHSIVKDFRLKRHDLLAYHNNKFDRDYVEFNVKISDLECSLQVNDEHTNYISWISRSEGALHEILVYCSVVYRQRATDRDPTLVVQLKWGFLSAKIGYNYGRQPQLGS